MTALVLRSDNPLPQRRRNREITVENAQILFKSNFEGRQEQFNNEGDRYFNLHLTKDQADELLSQGWNVKTWGGKEEGEEPYYFLKVAVSYRIKPPRLVLITTAWYQGEARKCRTPLDEESCDMLDWAEYEFIDVTIEGSQYTVSGRTGIKAYLKTGFFMVREDELVKKYSHLPEIGVDPQLALPPGEMDDVIDAEVVGESWDDEEAPMRAMIEA